MSVTDSQREQVAVPQPALSLRGRVVAATGASVLSALVVNPLDVVKVRMQAQAAGDGMGLPQLRSYQAYCFHRSIPVRSSWQDGGRMVAPATSLVSELPTSTPSTSPMQQQAKRFGWLSARRSLWPAPKLAPAVPPGQCLCAAASTGANVIDLEALQDFEAPRTCSQPARRPTPGMLSTLRQIMQQEGVSSLWRGLDSALLMSVPTVLLYYPLYDSLLATLTAHTLDSPRLTIAAPVLAGAAARATTVCVVAPLEFVRTRQQAGALAPSGSAVPGAGGAGGANITGGNRGGGAGAGGLSTMQALRSSLGEGAASGTLVRALPRLWTGLSATIARDVPFSAIYWGLVEPIRGTMLKYSSQAQVTGPVSVVSAQNRPIVTGVSEPGARTAAEGTCTSQEDVWAAAEQDAVDNQLQSAAVATSHMPAGPSHSQLVAANLVAGSLAGALAAAATTPFDVVKTRMQLAKGKPQSVAVVMRQVLEQQGVQGLFVGVGPRSARCAPACAIVIACYEVLKKVLSSPE